MRLRYKLEEVMRWEPLLSHKKRGQATAIGGLLFLMIVIIMTGFMFEISKEQVEMTLIDTERAQERVRISSVFFGKMRTYTNGSETFSVEIKYGSGNPFSANGLEAQEIVGSIQPIPNMNFSSDASGWSFTRAYVNANTGASGSYTTDATGSPTGAGGIFASFIYNPPSGETSQATMNWTARFFVDLTLLGGNVSSAYLSWGKKVVTYRNVVGPAAEKIFIYLKAPNGTEILVDSKEVTSEDADWTQYNGVSLPASFFIESGFYSLTIKSIAELSRSLVESPEFTVYFDDIGITLSNTVYVVEWQAVVELEEPATTINKMEIKMVNRYNVSDVLHTTSIRDYISDKWVRISTSLVSTLPSTTRFSIEEFVANYIGTGAEQQKVRVKVYALKTVPFKAFCDLYELKDLYVAGERDTIIIEVENMGGVSVTAKALWIISPVGAKRYELNLLIKGGDTVLIEMTHKWIPGDHDFKLITTKGTISYFSATA
jgi:hypothetical protein